ncbi:MAG: uracil-DNA glycosylase family protein [Prevotella sp.]|jgi:G:T/U-mismatch repair DNA glycosylase
MNPIETHPFEPFLPGNARLLMLGTFPPSEKRWSMKFYYPNFQNDMWRIIGWIYFADKHHFEIDGEKRFNLDVLTSFLKEHGFALYDTAYRIRRTKGTASDKDLEIIEPTDLDSLLRALPHCQGVLTAGQLATQVFTQHYGIDVKKLKMGQSVPFQFGDRQLRLYRMPSSSRAYPMSIEKKADYYRAMFEELGLLEPELTENPKSI